MVKRTALAIAALVLVVGVALAQPGPGSPMAMPGQPVSATEKVERPASPEMTPAQLDKVDALRVSHLKEILPLQTDLQIKELEMAALWRAEKLDAKRIVAKVKEISDVRAKLELARVNHRLAVYEIMTPEQRKAMGPGMMGPRGVRGMMGGPGMGRRVMKRVIMKTDDQGCPIGGCCPEGPGQCSPQNCPECEMQ